MSSLNPSDTSIAKSVLTEPIPAPAEKTTVGKATDNNEMKDDLIDYNEVDGVVNHSRETKKEDIARCSRRKWFRFAKCAHK